MPALPRVLFAVALVLVTGCQAPQGLPSGSAEIPVTDRIGEPAAAPEAAAEPTPTGSASGSAGITLVVMPDPTAVATWSPPR